MATTVNVTLHKEDYETRLTNGRHIVVGDEPLDLGGGDKGPAPYELLLMSLGSCSIITMKMYAQRKGYDIRHVEMDLTHEKISRDGGDGVTIKQDVIHKKVTLVGDLSESERERLLQISSMCPVHRTLEGVVEITSEFV